MGTKPAPSNVVVSENSIRLGWINSTRWSWVKAFGPRAPVLRFYQRTVHCNPQPSIEDRPIYTLMKERGNVDKWSDWFKHAEFYYVALLYMLTRMIVNITATYIPFYLQISLNLDKKYIAVVPLVQYITGFCVSFTMKPLSKHLGKNGTFFLGAILTITASIWGTILDEDMSYFGVSFWCWYNNSPCSVSCNYC